MALPEDQHKRFAAWDAAQGFIVLTGKWHAQLVGETLPAAVVEFSGVCQHTVQVEDKALDRHFIMLLFLKPIQARSPVLLFQRPAAHPYGKT